MKKIPVLSLLVFLIVLATAGVVSARSAQHFEAHLTADGEPYPVDSQGVGQAVFRVAENGQTVHYRVLVANIENVHMAHIHYLPEGSASGPVSVWLYPERPPAQLIPGTSNGVLMFGTITQEDLDALKPASGIDTRPIQTMAQLLAAMENGQTYVNVHTIQYPTGEIRGPIE